MNILNHIREAIDENWADLEQLYMIIVSILVGLTIILLLGGMVLGVFHLLKKALEPVITPMVRVLVNTIEKRVLHFLKYMLTGIKETFINLFKGTKPQLSLHKLLIKKLIPLGETDLLGYVFEKERVSGATKVTIYKKIKKTLRNEGRWNGWKLPVRRKITEF